MPDQPVRRRLTSTVVATKPGCEPLKRMYEAALASEPRSWTEIEGDFLLAMEQFDANIASGLADMGDLQNGKGDFVNDLLALLLENCAGVSLWSRGGVPGLVFPNHNLDVVFPPVGLIEFNLEAKAVGTPRHPGNPKQKNVLGRPGAADLDKRIKEAAFKAIDLKAEYGRLQSQSGTSPSSGPGGGSLTTWLRTMKPSCYLFIAARVISEGDRDRVVHFASVASRVLDSVGVFCYGPASASQPIPYVKVPVNNPAFELERILFEACQDLAGLRNRQDPPLTSP
jgi:hypothetical protein